MRVIADRASSKRKFEVSNAPSNKRKKVSPNLFVTVTKLGSCCYVNNIESKKDSCVIRGKPFQCL